MSNVERRRGKAVGGEGASDGVEKFSEGSKKVLLAEDVAGGSTKESVELDLSHLSSPPLLPSASRSSQPSPSLLPPNLS